MDFPCRAGAGRAGAVPPGWQAVPATLEELVLAYLREPGVSALPGPVPLQAGGGEPVR